MTKAVVPLEPVGSLTTNLQNLQTCYNYTPTDTDSDSTTHPVHISICTSTCECHIVHLRQKFEAETAPLKTFFDPEQYEDFIDQKILRYRKTTKQPEEPGLIRRVGERFNRGKEMVGKKGEEARRKIGERMRFVKSGIEAQLKRLDFKCWGVRI